MKKLFRLIIILFVILGMPITIVFYWTLNEVTFREAIQDGKSFISDKYNIWFKN